MSRTAAAERAPHEWSTNLSKSVDAKLDAELFLERVVVACAANVAVFDEAGALLYVSAAWRKFARRNGFTNAREGYGLFRLQPCKKTSGRQGTLNSFRDSVHKIIKNKQIEFQEEYILKLLPTPRWFVARSASVEVPSGFRILITLEDVTRRRQAEEELRNIGGRLIKAHEEERARLGRELHDDLSQQLAALSLELEHLVPQIPGDCNDLSDTVRQLSAKTQKLCTDVHRLSYQLHPFKLDNLGLCGAIECLCAELSSSRKLEITFRQFGFPRVIPPDVTLCVFRITQESLHNVIKHSGASTAHVVVKRLANAVCLQVTDNGRGFNVAVAKKKNRLGLVSIKERLSLVGGEISIRSQPNQGTYINVVIPLSESETGTSNFSQFAPHRAV